MNSFFSPGGWFLRCCVHENGTEDQRTTKIHNAPATTAAGIEASKNWRNEQQLGHFWTCELWKFQNVNNECELSHFNLCELLMWSVDLHNTVTVSVLEPLCPCWVLLFTVMSLTASTMGATSGSHMCSGLGWTAARAQNGSGGRFMQRWDCWINLAACQSFLITRTAGWWKLLHYVLAKHGGGPFGY